MLERLWIHIQTYTIIVLVNSPALFMLFTSGLSSPIVDFGPQSTAIEESPIEIYSIHIDVEEDFQKEEDESTLEITKKDIEKEAASKEKSVANPPKQNTIEGKEAAEKSKPANTTQKQKKVSSLTFRSFKKEKMKRRNKRASSRCTPNSNRRIQARSTNEYILQKKLVHTYLGNMKQLQKLAKAYWYKGKRGEGVLLQSIPCKSPLRNMGLRPKDIIISINGKKMSNNLDLIGSYMQLKSKKKIDIVVKRQAQPITLQYEIVKKLKKG